MRPTLLIVLASLVAASGCGRTTPAGSGTGTTSTVPAAGTSPATSPASGDAPAQRTAATTAIADASTNLDTTPIGAADYALYANIMGGASALLRAIEPADRDALAFARKVDAGTAKATTAAERDLLARARGLQRKDEELADLQGIGARYRQVKGRVEAVIGTRSKPPAPGDTLAQENLRFLEAHRATIERLQNVLRDPLNTP